MPRLPFLLALLGLTPLLGSAGCDVAGDLACTEIGCTDQVVVTLSANGGVPEGTFDLSVTIDGEERACVLTVQDRAVTSGSCAAAVRTAPAGDRTTFSLDVFFPIGAGGAAPDVAVRVQQGGAVLADGPAALRLEIAQPNGPDCPPTCRVYGTRVAV